MIKSIQIAYNDAFEQKCEIMSKAGFKYIAINFTEMVGKTEDEWKSATENIERILDKNSIFCIQSHPYFYDLTVSSEIVEEQYEFAITQAIIASGKIGAKWCALHPRSSVSSGFRTSKSLEDNRRDFSKHLECAKKHGTGIAAENLPVFAGIIPIMPFYSSNYEDLQTLVDSFNDENMGICWDTGHANMMSFAQADAIRTLGKRIKCAHIHNNFRRTDDHLPPDAGNIPWEKVMKAFGDIGYDGPFTLETHCRYPDPMILKTFAKYNYECLCWLESLKEKK